MGIRTNPSSHSVSSTAAALVTINVKDHGVIGDGTTDEKTALDAAVASLTSHSDLFLPPGQYKIATEGHGIDIDLGGKTDIGIIFAPGAELIMANTSGGAGTGNGIYIKGAGSRIRIVNPTIRWSPNPTSRSNGHGICVIGYPSDSAPASGWTETTGTVTDVKVIDPHIDNAPQTGMIFMGCDRPEVVNATVVESWADAVHFNACRQPRINGETVYWPGDDCLAFVTYFQASSTLTSGVTLPQATIPVADLEGFPDSGNVLVGTQLVTYTGKSATDGAGNLTGATGGSGSVANGSTVAMRVWQGDTGPFNQPSLGEWNNKGGSATGLSFRKGDANGLRLAGALDVTVSGGAFFDQAVCGAVVDAGITDATHAWAYLASRGCVVSGLSVEGASTGLMAQAFVVDSANDEKWWRHDVLYEACTVRNCTNRPVNCEGNGSSTSIVAGVSFRDIRCTGTTNVRFASLRDAIVKGISQRGGGEIQIFGQETALAAAMSTLPVHGVLFDQLNCDGGRILFQDRRGDQIGSIRSVNATNGGIEFFRSLDIDVDSAVVHYCHRANSGTSRGLFFNIAQFITVARYMQLHDANSTGTYTNIQFHNSNAFDTSKNCRILKARIRTDLNATGDSKITGSDTTSPNCTYDVDYYNSGDATPAWRREAWAFGPTIPETFCYPGVPGTAGASAVIGSEYIRTDGGAATSRYFKESATDSTGWVGK